MKITKDEDWLYAQIWEWIRELKVKYRDDSIVKIKANMIGFTDRFINENPELMAVLLESLVHSGRILSNLGNENIHPTQAYVLPANYDNVR
jgi:hypothetical protein